MQRAGRPVHVNDTLTHGTNGTRATKYFIPKRTTLRTYTAGTPPTDQVHTGDRSQDLFGPNWSTGGGEVSPNVTATAPTVSGTTGLVWNDGGGQVDDAGAIIGNAGPGARTKSFTVRNSGTDTQDDVLVSFDNGTNYFTLKPGESFSAETSLYYFFVKRGAVDNGSGGTIQNGVFEAIAVLA